MGKEEFRKAHVGVSTVLQVLTIAYVVLTLAADGKGPLVKEEVGEGGKG